jgi:hypothetical protein
MSKFKLVFPAVVLAGSLLAAPMVMAEDAQPTPPPPSTMPMGPGAKHMGTKTMSPEQRVDMHIARLHEQLKITAEQETAWKPVADVMRDNAKTLHDLHMAKLANVDSQTALDDLKSYRELAEAHYNCAKKLEDVFGTFYASLPADQQKLADTVFRQHKHNFRHMQQQSGQSPKGAQ